MQRGDENPVRDSIFPTADLRPGSFTAEDLELFSRIGMSIEGLEAGTAQDQKGFTLRVWQTAEGARLYTATDSVPPGFEAQGKSAVGALQGISRVPLREHRIVLLTPVELDEKTELSTLAREAEVGAGLCLRHHTSLHSDARLTAARDHADFFDLPLPELLDVAEPVKEDVDALQVDTEEAIAATLHDAGELSEGDCQELGRALLRTLLTRLTPAEFGALAVAQGISSPELPALYDLRVTWDGQTSDLALCRSQAEATRKAVTYARENRDEEDEELYGTLSLTLDWHPQHLQQPDGTPGALAFYLAEADDLSFMLIPR